MLSVFCIIYLYLLVAVVKVNDFGKQTAEWKNYTAVSQSVKRVQGSLAELEKTNHNSWRTSLRRGCLITIQTWAQPFWEEQWRPQCFQFVSREKLESGNVYDGLILSPCCTAKSGRDELDVRPMLPKNPEFLLKINLVWDLRGPSRHCSLHNDLLSVKDLKELIKVTLTLFMT